MRVATLFGLHAIPLLLAASIWAQDSVAAQPRLSVEEQSIHANAKAFVEAFNKADAKAVAALFAENGQMSVDGEAIVAGRSDVEKAYAEFFTENPATTISVTIDSVRLIGPNLAIEKGSSEITSSELPVVDAYTLVHARQEGQWLIATANVNQRSIMPEFDWKAELGFLAGQWLAEREDWQVKTSFEWVAGGNFLKRSFEVTSGGKVESSGVQVIGWDPLAGAVTSWTFGSEGGNGRGWWSRDGDNWVIDSEGATAGGEIVRATNVFTILGKDEFRWQSTGRSIDGVALEDTESIRVGRVSDN